ncbi:extracellular solute-binding protein [Methyloraptor flagellatus]|jgi:ABC-type uncharacterized transport system YnjBCD substrate-binding protein|uniref:Extracellular solute-binding protein n=1 Tax=Methyloraptor flagellatus TaxID=3162530 RepID=A0AAU7XBX7_9HYPH
MNRTYTHAIAAALLAATALATPARAAETGTALDRNAIRTAIATQLKAGGTLTVWADDSRFKTFFAEVVAPRFAKSRGIKVEFAVKPAATITTEIAAAKEAGRPSPADLVLMSDARARGFVEAGLASGRVLDLLPHSKDIDPAIANVADAAYMAGSTVPFDIRQQVVAFDQSKVAASAVETTEGLAAFAGSHPKRVGFVPGFGKQYGATFLETLLISLPVNGCRGFIYDAKLGERGADVWAHGECALHTVNYLRLLKPNAETRRTPAELMLALAKGRVDVAILDETDVAEAASRGALPATVRTTMLKTGQAREVTQIIVPMTAVHQLASYALADDLLSEAVQKAKLDRLGSRSPRASVMTAAVAPWYVPAARFAAATRAKPVGVLTEAVAPRVALEAFDLAQK